MSFHLAGNYRLSTTRTPQKFTIFKILCFKSNSTIVASFLKSKKWKRIMTWSRLRGVQQLERTDLFI
ncbi:hypothetical protein L6452_12854 [Arctium lappa]|uniref:Uncharacterized protein n=1 Tax=Arctium lappa TaxID=4217 RepID=A0ACB9CGJ2_ARCLA|nr:hypothetical protein L6452_12854 [Arctium lappa]